MRPQAWIAIFLGLLVGLLWVSAHHVQDNDTPMESEEVLVESADNIVDSEPVLSVGQPGIVSYASVSNITMYGEVVPVINEICILGVVDDFGELFILDLSAAYVQPRDVAIKLPWEINPNWRL